MSNLHRIQWFDQQIRRNRYPNARILADEYSISYRQAARDIQYMRYTLNAPLEYDAKRNGYYYCDTIFTLPGIMITSREKQILSFLIDQYRQTGNQTAQHIASLFARIGSFFSSGNRRKKRSRTQSANNFQTDSAGS